MHLKSCEEILVQANGAAVLLSLTARKNLAVGEILKIKLG